MKKGTKTYTQTSRPVLVFLDIDGTLLKPDYKPNSSALPRLIKKLSNKNYIFCLNSNRAFADLRLIARKFHIAGPQIGEGGTSVLIRGKVYSLVKARPLKRKLEAILKRLAEKSGTALYTIDTVRDAGKLRYRNGNVWLNNSHRIYTASIHVRRNGNRDLVGAGKLARALRADLGTEYRIDVSKVFANVLVSPVSSDKGLAIRALRKRFFPDAKVYMVGDDNADLPVIKEVDRFFAVANAETSLKRVAAYVSPKPYTQGVVDILRYIDNLS